MYINLVEQGLNKPRFGYFSWFAKLMLHNYIIPFLSAFASITNEYHTMGSTAEMNIVHKLQQQMNNLGCVIHAWSLLMSRERNNK